MCFKGSKTMKASGLIRLMRGKKYTPVIAIWNLKKSFNLLNIFFNIKWSSTINNLNLGIVQSF